MLRSTLLLGQSAQHSDSPFVNSERFSIWHRGEFMNAQSALWHSRLNLQTHISMIARSCPFLPISIKMYCSEIISFFCDMSTEHVHFTLRPFYWKTTGKCKSYLFSDSIRHCPFGRPICDQALTSWLMSWDVASIYLQFSNLMTPSILWSTPVPAAAKHPHNMMLPPPSFMVERVFFGLQASPFFLPA